MKANSLPLCRSLLWQYMSSETTKSRIVNDFSSVYSGYTSEEDESKLQKLISDWGLTDFLSEFSVFRVYLACEYKLMAASRDFWALDKEQSWQGYNLQLQSLRDFVESGSFDQIDQIAFYSGESRVTISNEDLLKQIGEFIAFKSIKFRVNALQEKSNPSPDIKYRTSLGKKFVESALFPFYNFITREVFPDKHTNKDRCVFVVDFVKTFELQWDNFLSGSGQPAHEYLIHTFKRLS